MNKLELISTLKRESRISRGDAAAVVKIFFDSMKEALIEGDRIELRGFCSFFVKDYKGYIGRNPRTGEQVEVKTKRMPFFKCGRELRERVGKKHVKRRRRH